jgi:hypothetical protein
MRDYGILKPVEYYEGKLRKRENNGGDKPNQGRIYV